MWSGATAIALMMPMFHPAAFFFISIMIIAHNSIDFNLFNSLIQDLNFKLDYYKCQIILTLLEIQEFTLIRLI